jgi:hypothetical protein
MSTTSTTDLQGILSAKKAELNGQPEPFPHPTLDDAVITHVEVVDMATGEIVPVAAEQDPPPLSAAPAPVDPIVHYPEVPPKVVGGLPYIREYVKLARTIDQTEMVPSAFRGRYDAITAAFMRGYELGLGPMQALDSFNVIQGKVGLSAEAMRALILNAGHIFILTEELGVATVTARRKDWPESIPSAVYSYTMDDADTAQLLRLPQSGKPGGWQKNPRAMLAARATSGAARAWFADVLAGMSYTPEEIRDFTDEQEVSPSPSSAVTSSPPVDAPSPTASSVTSAEAPASTEPSDSTSAKPSEPPKRPRGRPKKATTAPADGPSASPTTESTDPPSPAPDSASPTKSDEQLPLGPPETTSLNSGLEASLQPSSPPGVRRQMTSALVAIIAGLPTVQQPLCRAFLRQHFPDPSVELTEDEIQKCCDIAAGWPDSADQHPLPGGPDENPF